MPSFFEFNDLLTSAAKNFLSKNLKTFDDTNKEVTDEMKDDITNVRTTNDLYMQINHDCVENNNDVDNKNGTNFASKHCHLASSDKKTFCNASTDSTHTYFVNVTKTIGINVDADREEYNKAKSFPSQYPINEFTDDEYGIIVAFSHVFIFGTAYNKNISNLKQIDCIHILMQFSASATCQMLIFHLFDMLRRHGNIHGMSTHCKADPTKFDKFLEEIMSNVCQEKLRNAVAHPESKDSKYVLNKLLPVLTTAGNHICFRT